MKLAFETDAGIGTRATMGLIVLQTDTTIEHEFARLMALDGVALYHSRIPMQHEVRDDTLRGMEADLPAAAALLPSNLRFDVIGYGCTSAAATIGSDAVEGAIRQAHPEAAATDPLRAVLAAADALNARRIGFLSPYVANVSQTLRHRIEAAGHQIVAFASFDEADDRIVGMIAPGSILRAIETLTATAECDAIVVSCTNLRLLGIITEAENRAGCPVIASNLALAWHMRKLAGLTANTENAGELLRLRS